MQPLGRTPEPAPESVVSTWLSKYPATAPVVVVPLYNAYDDVMECLDSLLGSTPADVPILAIDDASTDDRISPALRNLAAQRGLGYVRQPTNRGFVQNVNCAFRWCAPRDVVLVNSDVVVPHAWLERLQAAAYAFSTVATATPLTNNGTLVSLPDRNRPTPQLPGDMLLPEVDARIRAASRRLRPILPSGIGHCLYVRRLAIDAVGEFDEVFSPGYGEEVDFSQRAVRLGFSHVLADDVFVYHKGWRTFGAKGEAAKLQIQAQHERIVNTRYAWYPAWIRQVESDEQSDLAQALAGARSALLGHKIAVDATKAGGPVTGTQVLTLELIRGLTASRHRFGSLSLIVSDGITSDDLRGVDKLVDEVVPVSRLGDLEKPAFDLIHCPYQLTSFDHLNLLRHAGRRLVVSMLDCIYYSSPAYAANFREWDNYRRLTEEVFSSADGIAFISQAAADEAVQQGLSIPGERSAITYAGVDHRLETDENAVPPAEAENLAGQPFVLVLSTNFRHKNRVYALKVMEALWAHHGWPGRLVLTGANVSSGGSQAEEAQVLAQNPALAARVQYIGTVSTGAKKWLLQNAALVLYPSIREGFGMVPFEAALAGRPALSTRLASLGEVLGEEVMYLENLNPEAGAELVWALISDPAQAERQVQLIRSRAAQFTWDRAAELSWDFYRRIIDLPARGVRWQPVARKAGRTFKINEPVATSWPGRIKRSWQILRTQGIRPLVWETGQFLQWWAGR
ncbi:MAG TPA: glycosyltransferase [Anaerolineae bacterium]